jgi:DNA-binding transcriptional ArsR family regulator
MSVVPNNELRPFVRPQAAVRQAFNSCGGGVQSSEASFARTVATTMHMLGAESRVQILRRLAVGSCSVNELARELGMERAAVSKQLRLLSGSGLVKGRRQGQQVIYSIPDRHVGELLDGLATQAQELTIAARVAREEATTAMTIRLREHLQRQREKRFAELRNGAAALHRA